MRCQLSFFFTGSPEPGQVSVVRRPQVPSTSAERQEAFPAFIPGAIYCLRYTNWVSIAFALQSAGLNRFVLRIV